MTWRLLVCMAISLLCPLLTLADTLIVAGQAQPLASPFILEGNEVLAPVLPYLRLLGITGRQQQDAIILTAPDGRTLTLKLGATAAELDGKKMTLAAAPRVVAGDVYLPTNAIAPFLDANLRYHKAEATLTLTPYVQFSYAERDDAVIISARSAAPLQYTSGWLKDPPRAYFDFKHAALKNDEGQFDVRAGGIQRIRLSQYNIAPDIVRIVVDCDALYPAQAVIGEQGRLLIMTVGGTGVTTTGGATPLILPGAPPRLLDAALTTLSPQQSELTFAANGALTVHSAYEEKTRRLTLEFANAENAIPPERLKPLTDRLVSEVAVLTPSAPGIAKIVVTLRSDAGFLIDSDTTGVRVLLGEFSLKDMLITLDAGHGGIRPGAVGAAGTFEKEMNLDIVLRAAQLLRNAGARIQLIRADDTDIDVTRRPGIANAAKADLFISVHCNSSATRNSGQGTETYYRTPQSAHFATAMHQELVKALGLRDGGIRNNQNFYVIRETRMPSVLLEIAYLNNAREEQLLRTPDFRQKAAQGILNGVRRYAASNDWLHRKNNASDLPPAVTVVAAQQ